MTRLAVPWIGVEQLLYQERYVSMPNTADMFCELARVFRKDAKKVASQPEAMRLMLIGDDLEMRALVMSFEDNDPGPGELFEMSRGYEGELCEKCHEVLFLIEGTKYCPECDACRKCGGLITECICWQEE